MNDSIKEGLEGLSKMDGVSNFLYALMYWVGVIFVLLFVTYIFVSIYVRAQNKKRGIDTKEKEEGIRPSASISSWMPCHSICRCLPMSGDTTMNCATGRIGLTLRS